MNTKTTTTPTPDRKPMPEPKDGWPRDNYTGHFGYFKRDPFTGRREPADEATRKAMEAIGITSADGPIGEPAPPAATAGDTAAGAAA